MQGGRVLPAMQATQPCTARSWPAVVHLFTPDLLHAFLCSPAAVWTSTLQRTIITASGLHYPKVQWKALDEIQVGSMQDWAGMACSVAGGWDPKEGGAGHRCVATCRPARPAWVVGRLVLFVCSTRAPACAASGQLQ